MIVLCVVLVTIIIFIIILTFMLLINRHKSTSSRSVPDPGMGIYPLRTFDVRTMFPSLTGGTTDTSNSSTNNPRQTLKFTPEDVIRNNIPIASISKLVLACIYHMHTINYPDLLQQQIAPLPDHPNLKFNVDELLHMKGGIPFATNGNTYSDVISSINILTNYTNHSLYKPTTYSNVTFMLLAYSLEQLTGSTYLNSLAQLCSQLNLVNTWSCSLWKPGSGDIVTTESDIIKIGQYVQSHYEWFADDLNHTCYRGRGIDVISSNIELLNQPNITTEFIIKDGSQGVPMTSQTNFIINDVPAKYYSSGEIKHSCRLIIPKSGPVTFINSLTDIHPFTYPLIPNHQFVKPTFDPNAEFCIDLNGSSIELGDSVEILQPNSYQIFNYTTDFTNYSTFPSSIDSSKITEVTFIGRGTFTLPTTATQILHNKFIRINFTLGNQSFHPIFIIDNITNNSIYLISPFIESQHPYAQLDTSTLQLNLYS